MEGSGTKGSWSEEMLKLVMENTLDQWLEDLTRFRGEDEPSMLDLVFTKKKKNGTPTHHKVPKPSGKK